MSGVAQNLEQQIKQQQAVMQAMIGQMQLPQVVFNSFGHGHSASEFTSILSFGTRPILTLIMAPVVAKSFAISLLKMVEQYEEALGEKIKTVDELAPLIAKYTETHE